MSTTSSFTPSEIVNAVRRFVLDLLSAGSTVQRCGNCRSGEKRCASVGPPGSSTWGDVPRSSRTLNWYTPSLFLICTRIGGRKRPGASYLASVGLLLFDEKSVGIDTFGISSQSLGSSGQTR